MSSLSLRCLKAACAYLILGISLGASFALSRATGARLRPLHAELNIWGCVTIFIYGMAYHMLPRFSGRPLRRARLAGAQAWLAIGGVACAALGWCGQLLEQLPAARALLAAGGLLQTLAALIFAALMLELLWPGRQPQPH